MANGKPEGQGKKVLDGAERLWKQGTHGYDEAKRYVASRLDAERAKKAEYRRKRGG